MAENSVFKDEDLLKLGLWFSDATVKFRSGQLLSWKQKGIVRVNDLLREDGTLMDFSEIKRIYKVNGLEMDYKSLIFSLKNNIKSAVGKGVLPNPIMHPIISFVLSRKQGAGHIYDLLYKSIPKTGKEWEHYWDQKFTREVDWQDIYCSVRNATNSTYYASLHYKIISRTCVTNYLLYRIGIKNQPLCERCVCALDTVEHKFYSCCKVKAFWKKVRDFFAEYGIHEQFNLNTVLSGKTNHEIVNHAIIAGKAHIQNIDWIDNIEPFITKLLKDREVEKYVAVATGKLEPFEKKWEIFRHL